MSGCLSYVLDVSVLVLSVTSMLSIGLGDAYPLGGSGVCVRYRAAYQGFQPDAAACAPGRGRNGLFPVLEAFLVGAVTASRFRGLGRDRSIRGQPVRIEGGSAVMRGLQPVAAPASLASQRLEAFSAGKSRGRCAAVSDVAPGPGVCACPRRARLGT